jgi:hypothetical protein
MPINNQQTMISQHILNTHLERNAIRQEICQLLEHFDTNSASSTHQHEKKGIYIYGNPGTGKTQFVLELLKSMDYDTITYDAGDVRNKTLFCNIDNNHISKYNVLDLMKRKKRKIAILMDEIDGMNNGDKGGLDALIKLIRQKKTKKQKAENTTLNPIICIGSHENDKKIRELMRACYVFELKIPTHTQIHRLLADYLTPYNGFSVDFQQQMKDYIQGDLRKLFFLQTLWKHKPDMLQEHTLRDIFHVKIFNEDAKTNTLKLLQSTKPLDDHNRFMNETDRTTVSLLWHENVLHHFKGQPIEKVFPFYRQILENICFADYIGRITFQSQIWQFNEMTSLIKTFYNNMLLHREFPDSKKAAALTLGNIEFTKVLTKYSTEYNNQLFLQSLCQRMNMDKKDILCFFQELRMILGDGFYLNAEKMRSLSVYFQKDDIDLLDVKRIYRFLDKNVKKEDEGELFIDFGEEGEDDMDTGTNNNSM